MCSAPEKLEHSWHSPLGPIETSSGNQSDSPAGTTTPGITRVRLDSGSKTWISSWNGCLPLFEMLMAEAAGETSSAMLTPCGSLPAGGLGRATGCSAPWRAAQLRSRAAWRRSATAAGRSSPLKPTTPLWSTSAGLADQPAGGSVSSTSVHSNAPGEPVANAWRLRARAAGSEAETTVTGAGGAAASIEIARLELMPVPGNREFHGADADVLEPDQLALPQRAGVRIVGEFHRLDVFVRRRGGRGRGQRGRPGQQQRGEASQNCLPFRTR